MKSLSPRFGGETLELGNAVRNERDCTREWTLHSKEEHTARIPSDDDREKIPHQISITTHNIASYHIISYHVYIMSAYNVRRCSLIYHYDNDALRAWATTRGKKTRIHNLRYGPRARLIRYIYILPYLLSHVSSHVNITRYHIIWRQFMSYHILSYLLSPVSSRSGAQTGSTPGGPAGQWWMCPTGAGLRWMRAPPQTWQDNKTNKAIGPFIRGKISRGLCNPRKPWTAHINGTKCKPRTSFLLQAVAV